MLNSLSVKVTNYLAKENLIEHDDREIYEYGFKQILTTVLNLITVIVIGIAFGKVYQSMVLTFAFMFLRTYSGGYHASSHIQCYILTITSITTSLSIMNYVTTNIFICIGLIIFSSSIIIWLSPVETKNKPLDEIEKNVYRKKSIIVWGIEIGVMLLFVFLKMTNIYEPIIYAHLIISVSLIAGKIVLIRKK